MAGSSEVPQTPNPSDFIEVWGAGNIGAGVPSPEVLEQAARALHAVQEFLVEPIAQALKQVSADVAERNIDGMIPEAQRPVTYADLGRLVAWTDELRMGIGYLADPILDITLLAHEDLQTIAAGYIPDGVLGQPAWKERMRRFHGLDEALSYA